MVLNLTYDEDKLYETLEYWSRDMLNFDFLEKDLWIISPPYFVYDLKKMFLMFYSINWPNIIVSLPFLLQVLANICILIVCSRVCDVIGF